MSDINMQKTPKTPGNKEEKSLLTKRKTHGAETVSIEQFYKYFKQHVQNATPLNNILHPETNMETHNNKRVDFKAHLIIQ